MLLKSHRRFYVFLGFYAKLIGQSFSAFCASSFEYVSSVGSCHSLSEAVLLLSLTLFGLIGSKHFVHLLNLVFKSRNARYPEFIRKRVALQPNYALYNDILY